ncbi:MAG: FtsX-like permease family protein [Candidatus Diapherotrites archaeon]|jgi:putative ABC transport system permease protein|uniref:FtsX-like permease family protein n=1 Tax=Candidatus Iainarchaeum sp. TaxID=3101447 RepID=A0A7K4BZ52_9ARCH|nr:FtsX-like permease family protein [Candidatus Diapherotrites archaeon]
MSLLIFDLIENSLRNLGRAKIRTLLTLLGVIIGISAIVSLMSVGNGFSNSIESQLTELGSNTIFVIPMGSSFVKNTRMTPGDISFMEGVAGVTQVAPVYSTSAMLEFNKQKINVQVSAVDSKNANIFDNTGSFTVAEGRFAGANESGSIVIGDKISNTFFDKKIEIKKLVKLNGEEYRVIGVLAPQNQSFGGGFSGSTSVLMSLEAFKRIVPNPSAQIIFVKTISAESVNLVASDIKEYFEEKYGEGVVIVSSAEQLLEQVEAILGIVTIFLTGVGGIAILVGGVGITNSMVTSVLERTKEIGIMKALGASDKIILSIFLLESAFIGAVGGIIGIIVGYTLAIIIAFIAEMSGVPIIPDINLEITIGALIFSMIVGMLAGYFPALRASKMDPVSALRYE